MKELEQIYFKNREIYRNWLKENHDKCNGIWLIIYKKHTKTECVSYKEALEESLCFGWIDSIIKRLDEDRYIQKFSPRTNTSKWSELNKKYILSLIEQGKMTEAGLNKIESYVKTGKLGWTANDLKKEKPKKELIVPDFLKKAFAENEPALSNFNKLAPSYQKYYVSWITSAKREETVQRRLNEAIGLLKDNKKLGMK